MEDFMIKNIIEKYDTPIYVFDINILKQRIKYLKEHLSDKIKLCYAVKANTFIVNELSDDIERLEVCSPGEYKICHEQNVPQEKIVISGVYKTPSEIENMIVNSPKIGRYTIESLEQLELLDELSKKYNIKLNILLRLTSGNQFGVNEEDIENIIKNRDKYRKLNFVGIQYFSGTQKKSTKKIFRELDYLDNFINQLKTNYEFNVEELEYGGGFAVNYFDGHEFDEVTYLEEISKMFENLKYDGKIILELGRSISASCGSYLTKVVDKKTNKDENYAILDGGINQLVYFGQVMAMKFPYYDIYPKRQKEDIKKWNLMGSLCTVNDILVKQLPVSNLQLGDVFIFKNTGAYCMTECIALFLSRDLPKVALIKGDKIELVRNSIETYVLNMCNENKNIERKESKNG